MLRRQGLLKRLAAVRGGILPGRGTVGRIWPLARWIAGNRSATPRWPEGKGGPMEPSYRPTEVERGWYDWWESRGVFRPRPDPARTPFSMVIPPPNVTGVLHIGHALTISVEDALVRWRRMCGDDVLWVPGLDHAGIATQSVVERRLEAEKGLSRHALGRDGFLAEVRAWQGQYGGRINGQLRRLGASLAWEHEAFTLDEPRSRAVTEAFVRLFRRGLIFRRRRMVNWCPHLRTALSDIEVDVEQLAGPTKVVLPGRKEPVTLGVIHTFAYPVEPAPGVAPGEVLRVSTTRLETMLGDVAVAVHPEDPRYRHLLGKHVRHPIHGTRLPIIGDAELVDMALGTGAVKVTPAHDPYDLACAERHHLPVVSILNDDGTLNAHAGREFAGMERFAARAAVRARLEAAGLFEGEAPHAMALGRCSRSGDVLEPLVKPQWFVNSKPLADRALAAVEDGRMKLTPDAHVGTWRRWLGEIQDWCISRQLWWGHRIPAFRVQRASAEAGRSVRALPSALAAVAASLPESDANVYVDEDDGGSEWVVARSEAEARATVEVWDRAVRAAGIELPPVQGLQQDDDVLDTWFSSALFPISTLGWPHGKAAESMREGSGLLESTTGSGSRELDPSLARFYPLEVMETGSDILFFWVARMTMVCEALTGELPFREVLLHPIVRDKQGRKMSKSLGNVIDPIAVIEGLPLEAMLADLERGNLPKAEVRRASTVLKQEYPKGIPECGTDALRFALANYMQQGVQINMDVDRIQHFRFFCNKLWNAVRFGLQSLPPVPSIPRPSTSSSMSSSASCSTSSSTSSSASSTAIPGSFFPAGLGLEGRPLPPLASLPLGCQWILSRLHHTSESVSRGLHTFDLGSGTSALFEFVQNDLCDVFLEWSKPTLRVDPEAARDSTREQERYAVQATLGVCLDGALRLLHPFMPYLSEELFQRLHVWGIDGVRVDAPAHSPSARIPETLALAAFPVSTPCYDRSRAGMTASSRAPPSSPSSSSSSSFSSPSSFEAAYPSLSVLANVTAERRMGSVLAVVSALRSSLDAARRILGADRTGLTVTVVVSESSDADLLRTHRRELAFLQRLDPDELRVEVVPASDQGAALSSYAARGLVHSVPGGWVAIGLPATSAAMLGLEKERDRLRQRAAKSGKQADVVRTRMAQPKYAAGTPEHVQEQDRRAVAEAEASGKADDESARSLQRLLDSLRATQP